MVTCESRPLQRVSPASAVMEALPGPPATATGSSGRLDRAPSASTCGRTRKVVNYALLQRSRGKLRWKLDAVLTCKSFVRAWYRGERLIEPPSSWFPSKFPSGSLEPPTVSPTDGLTPKVVRRRAPMESLGNRPSVSASRQTAKGHPLPRCLHLCKLVDVRGCAPPNGEWTRRIHARRNDVGSTWAITGKQYWRSGVIRECGYGVLLLAHPEPRKDVAYSR